MAEANTVQPVSLTLEDLLLVAQTIQICSARGAFKAEELAAVGGVYNRVVAFLEASGALQKTNTGDEAGNQGEEK